MRNNLVFTHIEIDGEIDGTSGPLASSVASEPLSSKFFCQYSRILHPFNGFWSVFPIDPFSSRAGSVLIAIALSVIPPYLLLDC